MCERPGTSRPASRLQIQTISECRSCCRGPSDSDARHPGAGGVLAGRHSGGPTRSPSAGVVPADRYSYATVRCASVGDPLEVRHEVERVAVPGSWRRSGGPSLVWGFAICGCWSCLRGPSRGRDSRERGYMDVLAPCPQRQAAAAAERFLAGCLPGCAAASGHRGAARVHEGMLRRSGSAPYSTTTAVPLADTISMPLPWPSTS